MNDDEFYIKLTLKLALKAQGMTSPNPMVGAVIVKNGKIISEAFHRKPGTPHAEALVIEKAGAKAEGSTLYTNLEPCCHTEKRTPPCTKTIINARIKKVVIAMNDPNPEVSGKGILELQKAGISVKSGVLEDEAKILNEFYIKYITSRKPFVILKVAMTLDGKIATPEGKSRWITGEKARKTVHRLRSKVDAIMTAIGTVKADDPQLTSRIKGGKDPKRIVIDPELDIPLNAKILQIPPETFVVTKKFHSSQFNNPPSPSLTPLEKVIPPHPPLAKGGWGDLKWGKGRFSKEEKKKILIERSIQFIEYTGEKLDLDWLMERLGELEIISVLIEGGSSLNSHALEDSIIDKVMFFIAPIIIGGKESFPAVGGKTYKILNEAYRIKDSKIKRVGKDFLIEGYLR